MRNLIQSCPVEELSTYHHNSSQLYLVAKLELQNFK